MQLPPLVYNLQPLQYLPDDIRYNPLIDILPIVLDEVIQCPVMHIFNEHKESILVVVGEIILDDVFALTEGHYCDFFFQFIEIFVVFDGYYAHCEDLVFLAMQAGLVDLAHAALTDFVEKFVLEGGLLLAKSDLL